MEYVTVNLHVDILGINKGTIEIKNACTDWGKGGPRSWNVHCVWFVYKRVRTGPLVNTMDVPQRPRQSSGGVEAQPRIKALLVRGT